MLIVGEILFALIIAAIITSLFLDTREDDDASKARFQLLEAIRHHHPCVQSHINLVAAPPFDQDA